MNDKKVIEKPQVLAVGLRRLVRPRLSDLLETLKKHHDWQLKCKICNKDCGSVALVDLVYTWEPCRCEAAPYSHLVQTAYHAECYGERANPKHTRPHE